MRDWLNEGADPDDIEELTPEEIEESIRLAEAWRVFETAWEASGGKCRCGNNVSLQDAWEFGCCGGCMVDDQVA